MHSTAAARTLNTPELLELILSHLPERDLLLAQRVSRIWHSSVSTSPILQTTLHFRPDSIVLSEGCTLNPFITSAFPFLLTPQRHLSAEEIDHLDRKFSEIEPLPSLGSMTNTPSPLQYSAWIRNEKAWKRKEASWRKMYTSRPPATRTVFMNQYVGMDGELVTHATVEFGARASQNVEKRGWLKHGDHTMDVVQEDGLKMGVLYDYLYGCCLNDDPNLVMQFVRGYVDEWKAIAEAVRAQQLWGANFRESLGDGEVIGKGTMNELTLVVAIFWDDHGCCTDEWPEPWKDPERFRSDGYGAVEVGPLQKAESGMWD
jgi:hypothetical protein